MASLGILAGALALVVACGEDTYTAEPTPVADSGATSGSPTPAEPARDAAASDATSSSSGGGEDDAAAPGEPDSGSCSTSVALVVDPGAQAAATAALAALDPAATLEWDAAHGTLKNISDLRITLADCTGNVDVYTKFFETLSASPDLFQIDPAEWQADGVVTCESVVDHYSPLHIRRRTYGAYTMVNDVFSVVADRTDGGVTLRSFSGVYLPRPTAAMTAAIAACPDKPPSELEKPLTTPELPYNTFAPAPEAMCTIDGSDEYSRSAGDVVTIDPQIALQWEDTGSGVELHREGTATVVVAEPNWTPDLIRSDANCIDLDGNNHIGWVRHFDPGSGAVLFDHANPDPYCIVCLE